MATYGDSAYEHAKKAQVETGSENWMKEKPEAYNEIRAQEYAKKFEKFKTKYKSQEVADLKNADQAFSFQEGTTLYPILTEQYGMNNRTAFLVMTKMLTSGINVDKWEVGDVVKLNANGSFETWRSGKYSKVENAFDLTSPAPTVDTVESTPPPAAEKAKERVPFKQGDKIRVTKKIKTENVPDIKEPHPTIPNTDVILYGLGSGTLTPETKLIVLSEGFEFIAARTESGLEVNIKKTPDNLSSLTSETAPVAPIAPATPPKPDIVESKPAPKPDVIESKPADAVESRPAPAPDKVESRPAAAADAVQSRIPDAVESRPAPAPDVIESVEPTPDQLQSRAPDTVESRPHQAPDAVESTPAPTPDAIESVEPDVISS
ncbi:MAG: hypothetical protein AAB592_04300 [Patescibacteria group bacterium]